MTQNHNKLLCFFGFLFLMVVAIATTAIGLNFLSHSLRTNNLQYIVVIFTNENYSTCGTTIIADPSIKPLWNFTKVSYVTFPNHLGYSIADALNETFFVAVALPSGHSVVQIVNHQCDKLNLLKRNFANYVCQNFDHFQSFGFCFVSMEITKSTLNLGVVWWNSNLILDIYVNNI